MNQTSNTLRIDNRFLKLPAMLYITASLLIGSFLFYIAIKFDIELIILGLVVGSIFIYLFIRNPRIWIYAVAASTGFFFRTSDEGISFLDIFWGLFLIGGLLIWILWYLLISRKKLSRNLSDIMLFIFFILMLFNFFIAYLNECDLLLWAREYFTFFMILYFLPIREYFNEKRHLAILLIIFAFSVMYADYSQFTEYYFAVTHTAEYAFQLFQSVKLNHTLLTAGSFAGIIFTLYVKKLYMKIPMIFFTVFTITALATTFARTFWIIFFLLVVISFFFLPGVQRLKRILYSTITCLLLSFMVLFLFPNISGIIFQVMENRLFSSTQGKQDLSVVSRLTEYDVVIHKIAENPLGGNGLGKEFHFLNPISTLTVHTTFTHNGYLYFSYRLGIPLFLFYLFSLLYNFFISLRLSWNTKNDFTRVVSLSAMGWILILIISDFSTTQFMMRDGIFVTALAYGMTAIANNWEYGNNKIPEKKLLPDLNG